MKIVRYEHSATEMFCALGRFFCSREVHKELGGPIYSGDSTTWFVAFERDEVAGFVSLRDAGDYVWFDYGYVLPSHRGHGIYTQLAAERITVAKRIGKPLRNCIQEDRWRRHYPRRGWAERRRRGQWVYGQKDKP